MARQRGAEAPQWSRLSVVLALLVLTQLLAGSFPATGSAHDQTEPTVVPTPDAVGAMTSQAVATPMGVKSLVVDGDPIGTLIPAPAGAAAIYAVGREALYRSSDGGKSWERAGSPPPPGRVVAAEDSPLVLLAGERPPCARGGTGERLSRSDDGGATWQRVEGETDLKPLAIWRAAKLALGADCAGLRVSLDTGRTWREFPVLPPGSEVTAFAPLPTEDPARPAALLATTSEGGTSQLFRLDLADPTNPDLSGALTEFWGLGAPAGSGDIYVVGAAAGVLISSDSGANWLWHRNGLEEVTISVDPLVATEPIPEDELQRGFGIEAVAIDPASPDDLYIGTVGGLFVSEDVGATWEQVVGVEGPVETLVLAPEGGRLFAQTPEGVTVIPLPA